MTTFKVKEVSKYISNVLRRDSFLSNISVEGEVSNFKKSGGHSYFSIKDDEAMLKCVVFKTIPISQSLNLTDGQKVVVTGTVMTYEKGSYYQILCKNVEEVGRGNLYEQFLALKEKLSKEGLFNSELKKPIPKFPKNIGVVTAKNGAAIRDILNTLRRRYRIANIYFYPAKVQGIGASDEIALGVKYLDSLDFIDTIIVGRGGGSFEDLNAFNDENLIRTIFNCKKPVISAVGHETDFSISDFVADLRAPTPSAAAELAVPNIDDVKYTIEQYENQYKVLLKRKVQLMRAKFDMIMENKSFKNPLLIVENKTLLLDKLEKEIIDLFKNIIQRKEAKFNELVVGLDALSPLKTLLRGYSIVEKNDNVVKSVSDLNIGDNIKIILNDGNVNANII